MGLASVDYIFQWRLSNTFLSASLVPHNYIFKQHHKMWTLLLYIIIIQWNISSKTIPNPHNYTASNTVGMYHIQRILENSKTIYVLYIKFRKVHVKGSEGNILNVETFRVEAGPSLRCLVNPKAASLTSQWPWSWSYPKWIGSELSEAFTQLVP